VGGKRGSGGGGKRGRGGAGRGREEGEGRGREVAFNSRLPRSQAKVLESYPLTNFKIQEQDNGLLVPSYKSFVSSWFQLLKVHSHHIHIRLCFRVSKIK
jgi:hypothetical protein